MNGMMNGKWISWFDNGQKEKESIYIDSNKHGEWRSWYISGKEQYVINYALGEKEGTWVEWDEDGTKIVDGTYKKGKKWNGDFDREYFIDGKKAIQYVEQYPNGQKKIEGMLINRKKTGKWNNWYENGDRQYSGNYKNDKKDGEWIEWDYNGMELINGIYKNGVPWSGRFDDQFFSNGSIAQQILELYANGQKKIEGTLVNRKKSGIWETWYENGNKQYSGNYKNDKKDGEWIEWDYNGMELINGIYKNGVPWSGRFDDQFFSNGSIAQQILELYANGQKKIEGTLVNRKKSGIWETWYENGNKQYSGNYKNDKKNGEWIEWDNEGNVLINGSYKDGLKWEGRFGNESYVSGIHREEYSDRYSNGQLKSSGILINKVRIGIWNYWYANGVLELSLIHL